jgi:hypothetical protein
MNGKDVDVAYFKVLFKLLPEGTGDDHRNPQSGQPVTTLISEPGTSTPTPTKANKHKILK